MQLTKNFSLEELTATSKKVNNTPNTVQLSHLKETANMLQTLPIIRLRKMRNL